MRGRKSPAPYAEAGLSGSVQWIDCRGLKEPAGMGIGKDTTGPLYVCIARQSAVRLLFDLPC